jgi:hypothetical protein
MRVGTISPAGVAVLALLAPVPLVAARPPRLHSCRSVGVAAGRASDLRTTYRCSYARRTIGRLLEKGVAGLPKRGRWACSRKGHTWTCSRVRPRRRRGRIAFEFTADKPQPQPPAGKFAPPPAPVDPLLRCVDLWNADSANLASIGYHLAYHHQVTRVWIFELPPTEPGVAPRCVVIAVVPETDPEFGNDGEVSRVLGGWSLMATIAEIGDPVDVQRRAGTNANASMLADGRLALP